MEKPENIECKVRFVTPVIMVLLYTGVVFIGDGFFAVCVWTVESSLCNPNRPELFLMVKFCSKTLCGKELFFNH